MKIQKKNQLLLILRVAKVAQPPAKLVVEKELALKVLVKAKLLSLLNLTLQQILKREKEKKKEQTLKLQVEKKGMAMAMEKRLARMIKIPK